SQADQILGSSGYAPGSFAVPGRSQLDGVYEELLAAMYRVVLLREPDAPGLADNLQELREGKKSIEQAVRSALTCPEFVSKRSQFIEKYLPTARPFSGISVTPVAPTECLGTTLTGLANKYGSDKGTVHGAPPHRYTMLYDLIFYPVRDR